MNNSDAENSLPAVDKNAELEAEAAKEEAKEEAIYKLPQKQ